MVCSNLFCTAPSADLWEDTLATASAIASIAYVASVPEASLTLIPLIPRFAEFIVSISTVILFVISASAPTCKLNDNVSAAGNTIADADGTAITLDNLKKAVTGGSKVTYGNTSLTAMTDADADGVDDDDSSFITKDEAETKIKAEFIVSISTVILFVISASAPTC